MSHNGGAKFLRIKIRLFLPMLIFETCHNGTVVWMASVTFAKLLCRKSGGMGLVWEGYGSRRGRDNVITDNRHLNTPTNN